MRTRTLLALLACSVLLAHAPGRAQSVPFFALGAGVGGAPGALQDSCGGPSTLAAVEARAGLERGAFGVEARASLTAPLATHLCVLAAPLMREDGIHEEVHYPFRRGEISAADVRLRYRPLSAAPLVLHTGAGWLPSHDLPYLAAGVGVRGQGRVRLTLDVERAEYRIPFDRVWREWRDHRVVREVRREPDHRWEGGWSVRAGVELPFRR